jgi:branched-chain amino acid transport system permease protein
MRELFNLLLKGLALGCVYALASMGFAILFKVNRILNFAHGQFMATAAIIFVLLFTTAGFGVPAALGMSVLICIFLALTTGWGLINRISADNMNRRILATLGLALILKGLGSAILGKGALMNEMIPSGTLADVVILIGCIVAMLLLFLLFYKSPWGLYVRAASDNQHALLSLGVPVKKISFISFVFAGAVAGRCRVSFSAFIRSRNRRPRLHGNYHLSSDHPGRHRRT